MERCIRLLVFLIMLPGVSLAQQSYTVIAKSGLSLREKPSKESPVLAKLPFRAVVGKGSEIGDSLTVMDGENKVRGRWQKVYAPKLEKSGFVFDGFLLDGAKPEYESWCEKNNEPCHCELYGHGFRGTIYDYEAEGEPAEGDTIFTNEDIGVSIESKLMEIQPENTTDSVVVYYTLVESLYPFGDSKPSNMSWEEFSENNPHWTGSRPFKRIRGKQNFFRIPEPSYAMMEGWRKRDLGFGDTLTSVSGEGGYVEATAVKNGVAYVYQMQAALIKVVLYRNGKKHKTTYVKAYFTYGC